MRLPDFLVVGAQKGGTTSLFVLLSKHPQLFLPGRKELQFFSSPMLYPKGLEWYSQEFFSTCPKDRLAGEVSPQYMYSTEIARRVHDALPDARIIAILRDPIDRAWSHYQMTCRRQQETRAPEAAMAAALATDETDTDAPETARYLQFSDYERVLSEYLRLYGRDRLLILFQEDLDKRPEAVMRQVCAFLGIDEVIPENVNVRVHQSGEVRFKLLSRLVKGDNIARRVLRAFVPRKLRPTIVFWTEMFNIRPVKKDGVPDSLRHDFGAFARRQAAFLEREFGLVPPWPSASDADADAGRP
ncbi:sulfotransferase family protein [Thetidibacter halocola]|uniref:Sulfotransferase n=1 Tax=Thetidibacter halocola TaxID=2827239 RepID=A0A8J7WC80_9RHOB|nr:sulfotransferase [Thetidibacter halocola]MBS0124930.1 sulfotransferase [Thetidibacter halocola]